MACACASALEANRRSPGSFGAGGFNPGPSVRRAIWRGLLLAKTNPRPATLSGLRSALYQRIAKFPVSSWFPAIPSDDTLVSIVDELKLLGNMEQLFQELETRWQGIRHRFLEMNRVPTFMNKGSWSNNRCV
jgi:hypothetical protein